MGKNCCDKFNLSGTKFVAAPLCIEIYIGSTINSLDERLQGHEQSYIKWLNSLRNYCTSSEILKYGDYSIELLEDYPCSSKDAKNAREGHYIKTIPCVNKYIAGRTMKENYQDNKEKKIEYQKQYNKENIIKYTEYQKAYREKMKAKIIETIDTSPDVI